MRRSAAVVALVILLSGCASGGDPMSSPTPTSPSSPVSASPTAGTDGVPAARWSAILADLTKRGVSTENVEVLSARSVTWHSGALGCPRRGQMYTQALVDGMQVVVSAGGDRYDYRFGRGDVPKLCR